MRLRPDREFVQSLAGGLGQLRIVYLDSGTDSLSLSLKDLSWQIPRTDTGHWREYLAPIDRFFKGRVIPRRGKDPRLSHTPA